MKRAWLAALVVLVLAGTAQAGPIAITSSNGPTGWQALVSLSYGSFVADVDATGTAVDVTAHPAWAPDGGWISYAPTGYSPDNILAPTYNTPIAASNPEDQRTPIALFTRSFYGAEGWVLDMKLWADDTAFMRIDDVGLWIPTSHTWAQSTCESNPTSCSAAMFSTGSFTLGYTGDHTLEIMAYQIGTSTTLPDGTFWGNNTSNPFGIKYEGVLVPDGGASLILLGMSLAGLAAWRRRKG